LKKKERKWQSVSADEEDVVKAAADFRKAIIALRLL
jgi:hypothetical protein